MNKDFNNRRRRKNREKSRKTNRIIKLVLIILLFITVVFAVRKLFLKFSDNTESKIKIETRLESKLEVSKEKSKNIDNKNVKKDGETKKLGNINIESLNGNERANKGKIINPFSNVTFSKKDLEDRINNLDNILRRKIDLYPESKTTVLKYQDYKDDDSELKDVTEDLEKSKGYDRKVKLNYLNQWDVRWGADKVDNEYIAISGCGPTTLTMIYSTLTGDTSITPFEMAQRMHKLGLYTSEGGEYGLFTQGSADVGLSGFEIPLSKESVESELEKGRVIVALVVNNEIGDFTQSSGHYIVISEKREDGKFLIYDVNSYENTNKEWDFDRILSQSKLYYSIGKN